MRKKYLYRVFVDGAPVRDFQSLSPAMKLVDWYGLKGQKARHERSNEVTWPIVAEEIES